MEQNHELPSSFQETERCFYVCRSGCGRIAFRHRYSPNALFRAYFLLYQCDAKLQTVQWHGGEYDDSRLTREFPGSPVELDHIFKLSNNKIAALEIRS